MSSLKVISFYSEIFCYQRLKIIIEKQCQILDITISEFFIIGLIKLAKHKEDKQKVLKLYTILQTRFDTGQLVLSTCRKITRMPEVDQYKAKHGAYERSIDPYLVN